MIDDRDNSRQISSTISVAKNDKVSPTSHVSGIKIAIPEPTEGPESESPASNNTTKKKKRNASKRRLSW